MVNERPGPAGFEVEVRRREWVAPHLVRVTFGGDGIAGYDHNGFTDRYVKLVFPRPGVDYPEPFDLAAIREQFPAEQRPVLRTYTIRSFDPDAGELAIDFLHHGDEGIAAPWAASAQPGDRLLMLGPGGAYAPDPTAGWHLFVGDAAALPAIAAAVEALPAGASIVAVLEVADDAEAAYLALPAGAEIHWLHHDGAEPDLLAAVRDLDFASSDVHAFVHGELGTMRELRRHLLDDRGVTPERLSLSGYWRRGKDEDGFQAEKAEESRLARDAAAAAP